MSNGADSTSSDKALQTDSKPSVAKSTLLMTAGTMLSRITGLVRTWMMAYVLGAGMLASAYQVANNLPNIIYETIAGGMIAAAFLPVLMLVAENGGTEARNRYASNILNILALVLGVVSLAGIFLAEPLIATQTFTVDGNNEVVEHAVWLFRIFSVQILFYGLSGIVQGMLNAGRTFFITAIAPALNNLVVIASFAAYMFVSHSAPDVALWVLSIGTTMGVIVQFAVQIPSIRKQGFKWSPVLNLRDPAIKETLKIALPTMVFVLASIVGQSARNAFALGASASGPAMVAYAWMWFQLPYGVVAVSLSRAIFTEMSDAASKGDARGVQRYVGRGLSQTLVLMIPCAFCLVGLAQPIVGLFQSGAFTSNDTSMVAGLLVVWACGLPAFSIWSYLYNAFASVRSFMPFALLNVVLIALEVPLYWTLTSSSLGLYGIPAADVIYYVTYAVGSYVLVKKVIGKFAARQSDSADGIRGVDGEVMTVSDTEKITLLGRSDFMDIAKVVFAGIVSLFAMQFVLFVIPEGGTMLSLARVCVGGIIGVCVVGVISYALDVASIRNLGGAVKRKISPRCAGE